jgi:hypothetical protein
MVRGARPLISAISSIDSPQKKRISAMRPPLIQPVQPLQGAVDVQKLRGMFDRHGDRVF